LRGVAGPDLGLLPSRFQTRIEGSRYYKKPSKMGVFPGVIIPVPNKSMWAMNSGL